MQQIYCAGPWHRDGKHRSEPVAYCTNIRICRSEAALECNQVITVTQEIVFDISAGVMPVLLC
jgi:hypothetical protein